MPRLLSFWMCTPETGYCDTVKGGADLPGLVPGNAGCREIPGGWEKARREFQCTGPFLTTVT
jgi:hypothetical protein